MSSERRSYCARLVWKGGKVIYLRSYQGGSSNGVALARAFMTRPQVLFADEPTGNLDQHTAATVIDLLFALNRDHGTTLVLVTHDPQLAQRCDRTLRIQGGSVEAA